MRNIFKYGLLAMAIAVTSVGVRAQDIPVSGVVKDWLPTCILFPGVRQSFSQSY